ncbi:hypothetical protein D920_02259 [Enterococcus faecalis 13-SD-W-01]|nr:hypothetical protein D920_02259 [Enterococcus faecalis 13-SD-W-01]
MKNEKLLLLNNRSFSFFCAVFQKAHFNREKLTLRKKIFHFKLRRVKFNDFSKYSMKGRSKKQTVQ